MKYNKKYVYLAVWFNPRTVVLNLHDSPFVQNPFVHPFLQVGGDVG